MPQEKDKNLNEDIDLNDTIDNTLEKVEVDVRYMKPGTILVGKSFDKRGNKIKEANKPFSKSDIDSLLSRGILFLYYIPEAPKSSIGKKLPRLHQEPSEEEKAQIKSFRDKQINLRELIRQTYEKIKRKEYISLKLLRERLNNLIQEVIDKKRFIISLLKPQSRDKTFSSEGLFTHSVNVATLSMIASIHLRLKTPVILNVSLAGLLHDIGVVKLDPNIIDKETELTREEMIEVQKHPAYTVNILKSISGIQKNLLLMCLQHHELINGEGYPKKLNAKQILPLSQIITISEMYDALISYKPYCTSVQPNVALLYFYLRTGKIYHKKIANTFIKMVTERMKVSNIFPVGSRVILNTNEIGVVLGESKHTLRPNIEIVKDINHKELKRPIPIDLSSDVEREIMRVLKLPNGDTTIKQEEIIFRHFF